MNNVVIVFDEASLVLTKNDYVNITQFNRIRGDLTYAFFDEYKCFSVFENNVPLMSVYFTKITLEGKECYEISQIKHKLDRAPKLPNHLDEFNQATGELIRNVFLLLNEAIITNIKAENEVYFRYYVRNRKSHQYAIWAFQQRKNIAEFVDKLRFVFGVSD